MFSAMYMLITYWYLNFLTAGIAKTSKIKNPLLKAICAFFMLLLMLPLLVKEIFVESLIQWKKRGMPVSGTVVKVYTKGGEPICSTPIYDLATPGHHFYVEVNGHWHIAYRNGTVGRSHLNMRWEL